MKYWTCINGHKWKNNKSAKGTFLYGNSQTKCPICKISICKYVSDDGKYGAIHEGFLTNSLHRPSSKADRPKQQDKGRPVREKDITKAKTFRRKR